MRRSACLLALLALAPGTGARELAPTPMFETLTTDDGLPSTLLTAVQLDSAGHLWVGTLDGLARYDGLGFRVWQRNPAQPDSLPSNLVQSLLVDSRDRVWVGTTDGGLVELEPARDAFRAWRQGFSGTDVWALAEAPDGAIFAGTFKGGLNRIDAGGGVRVLRHDADDPSSIAADTVTELLIDRQGRLWVGTSAGLTRYAGTPGADGPLPAAQQFLAGRIVTALVEDAEGTVWIAAGAALFRAAAGAAPAAALEPYPLPPNAGSVTAILLAGERRWFATRHGVLLERGSGDFAEFRGGDPRHFAFPPGVVIDALVDREGGLWFAMMESGLVHVKPQWANFSLLRPPLRTEAPSTDARTRALARCEDGTLVSDGGPGELVRIDPLGGNAVPIAVLTEPARGTLPPVRSVLCARDGRYWIGHRLGVARYDPATRRRAAWDASDGIGNGPVDLMLEDVDGAVWASALGAALYRFGPDDRLVEYAADGERLSREIEQIALDANATLWAAGTDGISRYDRAADRFVRLSGAPAGRINAFAFGSGGTLWLQTVDALHEMRPVGDALEAVRRLDAGAGLPAVEAGSLFVAADGMLWLAGPRGLFRVDPDSGATRRYGRADGLFVPTLSIRPGVQFQDGRIALASTLGVVAFDPARLADNAVPPNVVLSEVSVQRGAARVALDPTRPLALAHGDRDLRVVARALSLADPLANRYRFRLEGFDDDWVEGTRGERVFSVLPAGRFVLRIEGANPSGVWGPTPLVLPLDVAPPPWARPWALLLYLIVALGLIALAVLAQRRRLERRHALDLAEARRAEAERQSQAKSDFLADVGHEIRTPMSGLLGMAELLLRTPLDQRQRGYVETVRRSGLHLLTLINDLLDLSRIEAGRFALEPQPTDLWALLDEVIALEQPLAAERGLVLEGQIAPDAPRHVVLDPLRFKQVLLNLVNNALKFTERGRVDVALRRDGEKLRIDVRDTGPGMSADSIARLFARYAPGMQRRRGGSGLGLAISRALVELMGGRIAVASEPGRGSTFSIVLAPAAAEAQPEAPTPEPAPLPRALSLLVVEDDATIRAVLVDLLAALGHHVEAGANGLDALRLLGERRFDAALLDLDLPGVDGLKLIRLLRRRELPDGPRLPALAITANSTPGIEAEARSAGFDGFLRKPVTAADLARALGALAEAGRISGDTAR